MPGGHYLGAPGLHPEGDGRCPCREGLGSLPQDNQRSPGKPLLHLQGICKCPELATRRERWRGAGLGDFSLLGMGARFVFLDESGFNVNMSRGRGHAGVSETPECYVPSKGPSISVLAAMSPELGVIHETHRGGATAALFAQFLDRLFPILHKVYKDTPVVLVMDNAVIHKTSRKEGIDVPKKIGEAGLFHLYTVPYSPQLNAIESLFAQAKSHALHEFACAPERRKDIEGVVREAFRKGERACRGHCRHRECDATGCVAGTSSSLVMSSWTSGWREGSRGVGDRRTKPPPEHREIQQIKEEVND